MLDSCDCDSGPLKTPTYWRFEERRAKRGAVNGNQYQRVTMAWTFNLEDLDSYEPV